MISWVAFLGHGVLGNQEKRIMKSRHFLAAVLSAATCAVCAGETAYPLYTVTVAAGITNNLDDATVSVISEAGGAAADVAFSALSGSITTGTFRKRGMGALRSSSGMGSFSGEARIEEGVLIIDNVGQLGPCVEKSKTDLGCYVLDCLGFSEEAEQIRAEKGPEPENRSDLS